MSLRLVRSAQRRYSEQFCEQIATRLSTDTKQQLEALYIQLAEAKFDRKKNPDDVDLQERVDDIKERIKDTKDKLEELRKSDDSKESS